MDPFSHKNEAILMVTGVLGGWSPQKNNMSHEKKNGWLFYIRDYTTQLYKDYNKPL